MPTGDNPGRPNSIPRRVAYDTPMPPGNPLPMQPPPQDPAGGNGRRSKANSNPPPDPPAKPRGNNPAGHGVMQAVCQSGLNPGLITPEELIREIQNIALSDIADWPVCPEYLRNAPEAFRRAISSVKTYLEKDVKGQPLYDPEGRPLYRFEITLWNKNAAQDQLSRWHGLYARDKVPVNLSQFNQFNIGPRLDLSRLSKEQLEQWYALAAIAEGGGEILDLEPGRLVPNGLS